MVRISPPSRWLLAILLVTLGSASGAQAPASGPAQEPEFRRPPAPARHEPEAAGPLAGVVWGSLRPKGESGTRFVHFSAFRGMRGCARDEFSAFRMSTDEVREEGCLLVALSDRRLLQVRWADGRVVRYPDTEWTLQTGLR